MAGINAARFIQDREPVILSRSEAYTGVLIDDLVTVGTEEPYRMFTSRAEYRMNLRHDSADLRLMHIGFNVGLQSSVCMEALEARREGIDEIKELLRNRRLGETETGEYPQLTGHVGKTLYQILKSPEVRLSDLVSLAPGLEKPEMWMHTAELDVKYEGYINRQNRQIRKFEKLERMRIPTSFDFAAVEGLSKESMEKLTTVRPASVGQASRISGVRNADIALLMVALGRRQEAKPR
jgi:tRNA uridine 5-carboxymethylaminomethyl modification enzyme